MPNEALQATAKGGPRLSAQVVRPTGPHGIETPDWTHIAKVTYGWRGYALSWRLR